MDSDVLIDMTKPIIEFLQKNYHPHTSVVVTNERVMIVEDVLSLPFPSED